MSTTIPVGTLILRGRPNNNSEEFSKVEDLSYKPAKYNKTYQRASTPNTTMFYGVVIPEGIKSGANDFRRLTTVCEICKLTAEEVLEGEQTVTFGIWRSTKEITLVSVLYNFDDYPLSEFTSGLKSQYEFDIVAYPDLINKTNLISEFWERQFGKEEIKNDFDYMLSAIYAERISWLKNPKIAGVLYPSVRTQEHRGRGFNIAISPSYAINNLILESVVQCTVYKKNGIILCNNDKQAIITRGQREFILSPINNPEEHLDIQTVEKILSKKIV